ncbi:Outer membrane protein beta-barrel domain-containing protein [Tenacibaculum sediminilitoris]|uniref:outer membrane beta-barrel protein n=1 Tax=Tenacibaculum sediminilitoris TaxID=1820334 RepID=UPI0038943534
MRKSILILAMILATVNVSAQFYVSASGGYSIPSAGVQFGTETTIAGVKNTYGSYGEGMHTQLRGGYFFDNTFGVEASFGYLHGTDQTIRKVTVPGNNVDVIARARAYGASASLVYKFTNNIYGRFGALIKVGGETEAKGYIKQDISGQPSPSGGNFPNGTYNETTFTQDYKGRLPLGFIGALGYKYELSNKVSLFAEFEYMGISVTRDKAIFQEFKSEIVTPDNNRTVVATIDNLPIGYSKEILYVDELTLTEAAAAEVNPYARKQLSEKVPYSSFGINFGISYSFGK